MEFTQEDRDALHRTWMSQKAKMRITQMEFAKKLGVSQIEFSELLRGSKPLTMSFISQFCRLLHVEPQQLLPSLKASSTGAPRVVFLESRMSVDGEIQRAYIEGNQVVVEYAHTIDPQDA
ncbi:helix-turn-helix domain-containing protein [Vibrio sp. TRT 21S02]|uniref:helix-turn-helix domain-containing protein n=1 Tax=unclassified Vibrio TaxID=2614977 RepID=UPI00349F75EE